MRCNSGLPFRRVCHSILLSAHLDLPATSFFLRQPSCRQTLGHTDAHYHFCFHLTSSCTLTLSSTCRHLRSSCHSPIDSILCPVSGSVLIVVFSYNRFVDKSMHPLWSPRLVQGRNRPEFDARVHITRLGGLEVLSVWRLGCLILLVLYLSIALELQVWNEEYAFEAKATQAHLSHPSWIHLTILFLS